MRYFVKLVNDEIDYLGTSIEIPKGCTEITKEKYETLMDTLSSIPIKDGYIKIVHLHIDGTYTVEYIEEIIEPEEE